jgi:ABC-2 type transport system permease protein
MKDLRDIAHMAVRHLRAVWRQPLWIVVSLVQPMVWLLLFGTLFQTIADVPDFGSDNYIEFIAPGVVVMTAFFGAGWSGMPVVDDIDRGVANRFLVSPVRHSSLLAGRLAASSVIFTVQALILIAAALVTGASFDNGVLGVTTLIAAAILVSAAFGCLSIGLALLVRRQETLLVTVQFLLLPLSFLSVTFMQKDLMPEWMQTLAGCNPLNWAVEAGRAAVTASPDWGMIAGKSALLVAFLGLCSLFAMRAFRTYQRSV